MDIFFWLGWILDAIAMIRTFVARVFASQPAIVHEKNPSHIAFVFTNTYEISVDVLTEIVHLCAINRICQVTFYDPFSMCSGHLQQLYKSVNFLWDHLQHEDPSMALPDVIFDRTSRELEKRRIDGSSSESLRVTLLGDGDGRSSLVDVCRDLSKEGSSENLSAAAISEKLKGRQLREPDLVVTVGTLSTFAGFPPWSLRVAEIVQIPTLTPMASDLFDTFLAAYSRRDRRLGR
ncbi:hypothetical protein QR680_014808 [Steinernema hermaphroditum]|uniref:ditrans,polycis-polyprenyl diphosphate synthase [(2E,6E)-farnesyldiphosphate specific] n=1 Tax=Steinernema hermaphroditum TaxID=289476 RepID=A0AA39ICE9_9BILA|nr:hypothetical protein QR680_014808 [Steinernema hermaphroditum]